MKRLSEEALQNVSHGYGFLKSKNELQASPIALAFNTTTSDHTVNFLVDSVK